MESSAKSYRIGVVLEQVRKTITRYSMFKAGDRVGVAVSGGADSVFLLHALHALRPRWDLQLTVLHLDHRLRGEESRGDADFVRELAAQLGLPAHIRECDVAGLKRSSGDNLEQTARNARRQYYREFLCEGDRVATGHTRSDQAETVLFRFLRGSGTAGLAGVRPLTSDRIVRPLIDIERSDVEQYLRDAGIRWREDASNTSRDFARNRIRHELLPLLIAGWNPALVSNLAHTAQWAQAEESYWEAEIDRVAAERLTVRPPAVLFQAKEIGKLPKAVARRLVRRALEVAKGDLRGICFEHVERILEIAAAEVGDGRLEVPGLDVWRSFDWIRIAPPSEEALDFRLAALAPGRFVLPDGSAVRLELIESSGEYNCVYNREVAVLDWDEGRGSLQLRSWKFGDRYHPRGRASGEKLKDLFQEARVPIWERRNWPILTMREEIVWARRFGPALNYAATPASRAVLKIWDERA
jgi:tRNA(Ile)-lysidine synthase